MKQQPFTLTCSACADEELHQPCEACPNRAGQDYLKREEANSARMRVQQSGTLPQHLTEKETDMNSTTPCRAFLEAQADPNFPPYREEPAFFKMSQEAEEAEGEKETGTNPRGCGPSTWTYEA